MFGALLDQDKGGYCRIRPIADEFATKQLYFPDTAALVTRYLTEEGVGEVIDFMPVTSAAQRRRHHRIVRMLRCIRGQMTFDLEIAPRFDYGREPHETEVSEGGRLREEGTTMAVHLVREPGDERWAAAPWMSGDVRAVPPGGRTGARADPGDGREAPRTGAGGGGGAPDGRDRGVLALLGRTVHVHRTMAGDAPAAPRSR